MTRSLKLKLLHYDDLWSPVLQDHCRTIAGPFKKNGLSGSGSPAIYILSLK
jgi:hypothetical protein